MSAADAPLDRPAPAAAEPHAHGSIHVDAVLPADPMLCPHHDGTTSIGWRAGSLTVWLVGTSDQFHTFAHRLHQLANEAATELVRAPTRDVEEPVVLPKPEEPAA